MKKIGILLACAALFGCVPAISASPPARDVGKVILVDDHSPASLTASSFQFEAPELVNLYVPSLAQVDHFALVAEPAIKIETPILNLVTPEAELEAVAAIRVSCEALLICKSNKFIKEKIYLTVCSIRQC